MKWLWAFVYFIVLFGLLRDLFILTMGGSLNSVSIFIVFLAAFIFMAVLFTEEIRKIKKGGESK